jgi:hypothetical protein
MKPVEATAVEFAHCLPLPDVEPKEQDRVGSPRTESKPADSALRSLAEKLSKMDADAGELKSDRFAVRQYAQSNAAAAPLGEDPAKPLAWYPLLIASPDGRVDVPGVAPVTGKTLHLIIDALGDGRIESCDLPLK